MGTQGVPWDVEKSVIIEALKRQKGRLTYACKDLDCAYETLKRHINKDPELQEIVSQLRNQFDCALLDTAESVLMKGMAQEDIAQALRASFYVLNNKGAERGYNHPEASQVKITPADLLELARAGKLKQSDKPE